VDLPTPRCLFKWRVPRLRAEVTRALARGEVDVCVADFLTAMPNLPRRTGGVPLILFEHNVEYRIWQRLARTESRAVVRRLLEIEWRKMGRYEAAACHRASRTVVVSETDRALLGELAPGARIEAVPTGVDTTYFAPNGTPEGRFDVVFTGPMDWYPNEDAMVYFMEKILPVVRRELPEARATVVGRNPGDPLRQMAARAGVRVTGTVGDVRPFVERAAVYVVPLRVGGGTRLKIFEALAMGKAVVATSVGVEGLPLVPGRDYILADEPDDFARAVVDLVRDPERRRALGRQGRRLVEERYSWPQIARTFEAQCWEVVECG
jgi:polysaccharide biosynthesis protein PslH